ncbi:OmpA family protein [Croceibacterium sp. LX-88]|uniref:OmpA family protein n=2 Tax=Croceibacterium selenioxidans TaxID=2838833 RepID=A0ABS5W066_9SPHN|nr:OmpA family protein [Croceibacterium selenioxidans]
MMRSPVTVLLGLVPVAALAFLANALNGRDMAAHLDAQARVAIAKAGGAPVQARFATATGSPSRHPLLSGGEKLDEGTRDRVAKAVSAVPGVGGVTWVDGTALAVTTQSSIKPQHCQDDVEALLNSRTIRFEGGSSRIQAASGELVDEVAAALRPCLGSIIAITGHTDSSGPEPGNLQLSLARARAVRDALIERGIPADGLRTRGLGSRSPVEGLDATDPANRRIEFSVLAIQPVKPTPVDTPGPR